MNARRLLKALWLRACRHDDIGKSGRGRHRYDDAMFVVFSDDNPHMARYSRVMRLVLMGGNYARQSY